MTMGQALHGMVDLEYACRRPLQKLLQDCKFSEWENIALFLDSGATEAVRWAGGLGFLLQELGISLVLDLQVCLQVSACAYLLDYVYNSNVSCCIGWIYA